jgi:hypothetical protein
MAAKRKRKRADKPRLDDNSNWLILPMVHHTRSEQLKDTPFFYLLAKQQLLEILKNGKLRCMRKSRTNPFKREWVPAAFWHDLATLEKALSSSNPISRTKAPHAIFGWDYYVWGPDIDMIWGKSVVHQRSPTRRRRRARRNPASRSEATAATKAAGPAQPERSEPEQLPQRIIKPRRGGQRLSLTPDEIEQGKAYCRRMLDENPAWIDQVGIEGAALAVITEVLKRLEVKNWQTVKRNIIWPVMEERGLR